MWWLTTVALMGVVVYVQYEDVKDYGHEKPGWSMLQRTAYETLSRTAWGLAIGWIIYACNYGYAGT